MYDEFNICLMLNNSIGLSVGIESAGDLVPQTSKVRTLHLAEEDILSPFDSKIVYVCQSIKINKKLQYSLLCMVNRQQKISGICGYKILEPPFKRHMKKMISL